MILTGDDKKKAYSKTDPEDCSFQELVTLLCTADGKGSLYKLRCIKELLSYNDIYAEQRYQEVIDELRRRGVAVE